MSYGVYRRRYQPPIRRSFIGSTPAFIFKVKTDNTGTSNDDQFTLPLFNMAGYNFAINWGDGTSNTITTWNDANLTHTYAGGAGTYTIRITGTIPRIYFNNGGDKLKFIEITSWGPSLGWTSFANSFYGCSNLDVTAPNTPDLSGVTSLLAMFKGCASLVGTTYFNSWDVATITDASEMFRSATVFNQDLSGWDTGNMLYTYSMFQFAEAFNTSISAWDVSKVQWMDGMFNSSGYNQSLAGWVTTALETCSGMFYSTVFNQSVNHFDVSNVTDMGSMFALSVFNQPLNLWDVSSVVDMDYMFEGNTVFNQDLSAWVTTSLDNTSGMFYGATSFDQDIGDWDITSLTDATNMFEGVTLSTSNYDSLLVDWSGQTTPESSVTFSGGNSKYTITGEAGRDILTGTYSWTITDGGLRVSRNVNNRGGGISGQLYTAEGVTAQPIANGTSGTVLNFASDGVEKLMNAEATNKKIAVTYAGFCKVKFKLSGKVGAAATFSFQLLVDGVVEAGAKTSRYYSGTSDIGNQGFVALVALAGGAELKIRATHTDGSPVDYTPVSASLVCEMLGV